MQTFYPVSQQGMRQCVNLPDIIVDCSVIKMQLSNAHAYNILPSVSVRITAKYHLSVIMFDCSVIKMLKCVHSPLYRSKLKLNIRQCL